MNSVAKRYTLAAQSNITKKGVEKTLNTDTVTEPQSKNIFIPWTLPLGFMCACVCRCPQRQTLKKLSKLLLIKSGFWETSENVLFIMT